jgi:hypothetical protein
MRLHSLLIELQRVQLIPTGEFTILPYKADISLKSMFSAGSFQKHNNSFNDKSGPIKLQDTAARIFSSSAWSTDLRSDA